MELVSRIVDQIRYQISLERLFENLCGTMKLLDTGFIIKTCQRERKHERLVMYQGVSTAIPYGIFKEFQRYLSIGFLINNWSKNFPKTLGKNSDGVLFLLQWQDRPTPVVRASYTCIFPRNTGRLVFRKFLGRDWC